MKHWHPNKPCPFCGDELQVSEGGLLVHIEPEDCIIGQLGIPVDSPRQIRMWNTRNVGLSISPVMKQHIIWFVESLPQDRALGDLICCDGHECGCYGASIFDHFSGFLQSLETTFVPVRAVKVTEERDHVDVNGRHIRGESEHDRRRIVEVVKAAEYLGYERAKQEIKQALGIK